MMVMVSLITYTQATSQSIVVENITFLEGKIW